MCVVLFLLAVLLFSRRSLSLIKTSCNGVFNGAVVRVMVLGI